MLRVITTASLLCGASAAFEPAAVRPAVHRVAPVAAPDAVLRFRGGAAAPAATLTGFEGPGLVTAMWALISLNFMPLGPTAAMCGTTPGQQKWGDRTFMNMIEQAPIFFAALWSHAIFCSPETATALGFAYLTFRLAYPIIWALVGGGGVGAPFPQIFFSTFPQYGIAFYMALAVVLEVGLGIDLNEAVGAPLVVAPVGFGAFLYVFAIYGVPILQKNVFAKAFIA